LEQSDKDIILQYNMIMFGIYRKYVLNFFDNLRVTLHVISSLTRFMEHSGGGTKVPSVELSFSGTFVPWNFRSRGLSSPGTCVP